MRQEPIAYINVEQRELEFAKPIMWHTPTVVNLERIPLYTHQRTWVGLTQSDFNEIYDLFANKVSSDFIFEKMYSTIEAKLKQKNGYAEEKNT